MKSTGECLGIAETFNEALYKAFLGAGIKLPKYKNMIITVKDEDHARSSSDRKTISRHLDIVSMQPEEQPRVLKDNGIKAIRTNKLEQPAPNLMDLILGHKIDVVIDTPPQGVEHQKDGFVIRRNAIENRCQCSYQSGYSRSACNQPGKHRPAPPDADRYCNDSRQIKE